MNDERLGLPSASEWARLQLCPGSYQLSLKAEELGQVAHVAGPAALRGTRIHSWLAGEEVTLSGDELETAEFLKERAAEQVSRIFGDLHPLELAEKRLWFPLGGEPALSGQFDRVLYTQELALVQDFKTGWSEPDPIEQNAQMKVLAVLVALHLPKAKEVIVQIISGPYGVFEARYDLWRLSVAYEEIKKTLGSLYSREAAFAPSPQACQYCPAKLICQAVKDLIVPLSALPVAQLPLKGESAAEILDSISVLRSYFDQVEMFYEEHLKDPTYSIPGYQMVPGLVRREVTDWDKARERLGEWLDLEQINGAANYRLGDLEKALAKKLSLRPKEAKERMNQILAGLVAERQNASSLKRIKLEDQRAAATF
jgi:hypothetical protein